MSWLNRFKKKEPVVEVKPDPVAEEAVRIKNTLAPSVSTYPKKDYSAYWEIVLLEGGLGYKAKLRLYTHTTEKGKARLLEESVFEAVDEDTAKKLAWRAVTSKMDKYKR